MRSRLIRIGVTSTVALFASFQVARTAHAQGPDVPRLRTTLSAGITGIVHDRGGLGAPGVQGSLGLHVRGTERIGILLEGSVFAFRGEGGYGGEVDPPDPILSLTGSAVVRPVPKHRWYAVIGGGVFRTEARGGQRMVTKPGLSAGVGAMLTRSERVAIQMTYHHMLGNLPHTNGLFPLALVWRF